MKNLPITLKVTAGFIAVMIMFIIVVGITATNMQRLNENNRWVDHSRRVVTKLDVVFSIAKSCGSAERGYVATADSMYLSSFLNIQGDSLVHLEDLKRLTVDNKALHDTVLLIEDLFYARMAEIEKTIVTRNTRGFEASKRLLRSRAMPPLRVLLRDAISAEEKLLRESEDRVIVSMEKAKGVIMWMLLIACVVIVGLIMYVNHSVVAPIKRLSAKAENIALGDLSNHFVAINRGDEIGLLARSFDLMQSNLLKKARQAEEIANGNLTISVTPLSEEDVFGKSFNKMIMMFNAQMLEIQQGVNVLSTASNEMMAVMSQLASASSETASSVSETSATIEEIKQTTEISSKKADEVTTSSKKLASVSKEGNDAVQSSIGGMKDIKQQMGSIAAIVIELSERSHKIGEIANTVNDIAEQSNLLAVNASIEAAKAGEEGKGFAVVAQEIKNLASRSKESTVEIRSILTDIQKEIGGAVMATEQGGKVIDEGLDQSFKASDTISALASNAEESLQANMLISASSQQQLVGMEQITVAMESIREASVQNSNSTKQAELSVSELTELGGRLISLLGRYKLKND